MKDYIAVEREISGGIQKVYKFKMVVGLPLFVITILMAMNKVYGKWLC